MGYRRIIAQHYGILAIGFLAAFSGNLGQTFLVGFFQPAISASFSLTSGQFGIAYSLVTLISGCLIFFIGPKLDWWPARRFATFVVCGMTLGILLLTLSPWAALALIGFGFIRFCGQGMFVHLGTTIAARRIMQARGSALALVTLAIPLGEAILPSGIAGALHIWSWREIWWGALAVLLLVWIPALLLYPNWPPPSQTRPSKSDASTKKTSTPTPRPLREARFWRLSLMMLSVAIVNTGIFVFQADMIDEFNATSSTFAIGFALAAAGRVAGSLVAGRMVDRLGPALMGRLYLLPLLAGLVLAVILQNEWGILAYMLLSGIVTGMQEPTVTSLLIQFWGSEHLGRLRSIFVAGMVFSSGLAPATFGLLLDAGITFTSILMMMIAMVCIGFVLAWGPLTQSLHAQRNP
ncbi:MFS transporter [Chromohalobacter nigrandesensis]|uniref:MFS transporter n=1 Tax=Chromohalobacter nigrandesensis TaxID=119863 RepID=UPI001FF19E4B|nr:MFS transporter [Chromohalobacter nigrandesensis]